MKCQKCNKREATTHITKIINGYKEELHLCSECAAESAEYKEMKTGMNFGIGDFLTGMLGGKHLTSAEQGGVCPGCGMSYEEFLKVGKLGCGECYSAFKNRLTRPVKQIHGTFEHIGKVPKRSGGRMIINKRISNLEEKLNAAVLKQDFETAAKLRDEIKEIKANNQSEEA